MNAKEISQELKAKEDLIKLAEKIVEWDIADEALIEGLPKLEKITELARQALKTYKDVTEA